jgi:hypothetical protein
MILDIIFKCTNITLVTTEVKEKHSKSLSFYGKKREKRAE